MLRTRVRAGAAAGLVLSLAFGAFFTFVSVFELYVPALRPAYGEAAPVTLRIPYGPRLVRDERGRPVVTHERLVVPRGTVLDERIEDHRAALAYEATRSPPRGARVAGYFAIFVVVSLMLCAYMRRFGQSRVRLLRSQVGLFALIAGWLVGAKALLLFTGLPEFWIPTAAVPLWVALAFDRRTAFLIQVGVAFLAASLLRFDIVLFSVFLGRGVAASLFFLNRKHTKQMPAAGVIGGVAGAVAFVALSSVFEGRVTVLADLARGFGSNLLACVGGGVLAGLLARILHDPVERVLGHISRDKLLDLTDLEQPLLKKMAGEAPGSWEHARAMANLAEASASALGADALLTRVGAYYHDLGKTIQPKYFVENLAHGETSPHEELDPDVSADAIMAHVVLGTKILRDANIPEPVVEFAYTHHGTLVVEYFWHKCQEQGNPKGLSKEYFRYPGMKPQTKETAILMLVDSIEAASRTIWPPEHKKFEEMVQKVVFSKLSAGQLDESGLTVEDLRVMTTRMAATLVNMYHGRIKYPWQRDAEQRAVAAEGGAAAAGAATPPDTGAPAIEAATATPPPVVTDTVAPSADASPLPMTATPPPVSHAGTPPPPAGDDAPGPDPDVRASEGDRAGR
ncbi:MAG: HDIG domain-containing metalloprotein [Polyangiaceae bacterium]